jgi:hypothetical protein
MDRDLPRCSRHKTVASEHAACTKKGVEEPDARSPAERLRDAVTDALRLVGPPESALEPVLVIPAADEGPAKEP